MSLTLLDSILQLFSWTIEYSTECWQWVTIPYSKGNSLKKLTTNKTPVVAGYGSYNTKFQYL